jgi:formylglycine-generating enzyme required for sulfatase activity
VLADDGVKPVLGEKIVWEKDGAKMVLIPAGPSTSSFYMDMYEVTNAQYRKFVRATGHREPQYWHNSEYNQPNQPVIGVSWHDATAYAKWAGKRLPSEAEWEYAARGGLAGQRYVWGDETPTAERANYGSNVGKPTAVGSYPANGYGLYDMAGNVGEWCQDWYNSDRKYRVLRGGFWGYDAGLLRVAARDGSFPDSRRFGDGFRCVSGSDFTSGASVGGDFTSDEEASSNEEVPLPLAGNQGIIEWEKDNSEMALIPGGSFEMGDSKNETESWMKRSRLVHTVELDAFYMDVREVTVGQFREFVNQSGYSYGGNWDSVAKFSPGDEYPMVYVSWNDATAYAKWAGKRLPTEAEWEYAAVVG